MVAKGVCIMKMWMLKPEGLENQTSQLQVAALDSLHQSTETIHVGASTECAE